MSGFSKWCQQCNRPFEAFEAGTMWHELDCPYCTKGTKVPEKRAKHELEFKIEITDRDKLGDPDETAAAMRERLLSLLVCHLMTDVGKTTIVTVSDSMMARAAQFEGRIRVDGNTGIVTFNVREKWQ